MSPPAEDPIPRQPEEIAGDQQLQTEALEELTAAVNYRSILVGLGTPWLGEDPIEIGSGNGDYAECWAAAGQRLTVSEVVASRIEQLRGRFADEPLIDVRSLQLPSEERGEYSAAIAYNVLEHIEDDRGALVAMSDLVRDGGHVVIIVPAFSFAMSEFDRQLGHFRRYRVGEVEEKLREAGLEPVVVRYINCVGLIAWTVLVRLLHQPPKNTPMLRLYDRYVLPLVARFESRVSLPFGQSVFAVARRPEAVPT